jgi:nucleoside-diphosphate-sugar epimerase
MRVFVAGATGVIGRPTVHALVRDGHEVLGIARTADRMDLLRNLGAEPVLVDLFDQGALAKRLAGSDAVVNLATRIPPIAKMRRRSAWRENDRIRTEGSRAMVEGALAAGVGIYVQESITFIYADGGDRWLDEDSPTEAPTASNLASTLDAQGETARFTDAGGTGIVLRFSLFYAPRARSTADMIRLARRRMFPIIGDGAFYQSSVNVDDGAGAVVAALHAPAGIYNVCDDEPVTQREYVEALAGAFGFRHPRRAPAWLARASGGTVGRYLLRSQRVSNRRFKEAAGWSPRYASVREGFTAVARALADG